MARLYRRRDQELLGSHRCRSFAQFPQSARIALYPPSCGGWSFWSASLAVSSSSSKGSLSCIGSLYGASGQSGLGAWGLGFLATSRSISEPLADSALDGACGALAIVNT